MTPLAPLKAAADDDLGRGYAFRQSIFPIAITHGE